jgi:signal transduction histidine kinase
MGNHGSASTRGRPGAVANRPRSAAAGGSRRPGLLSLSNWPVSRRLFAVIVAALVMGLVFGGLRIASAEGSAAQFSRTSQLAKLGQQLTVLIQALQNERDETLSLLAGGNQNALNPLYAQTDTAVVGVQQAAVGIVGGDFPANIQNDVTTVLADISAARVHDLHTTLNSPQDELAVIGNYGADINDMITLTDQVGQGVSDASLASDVRAFNALALAKEQVSQQRALLNYSFSNPTGAPPAFSKSLAAIANGGAAALNPGTTVPVDQNTEHALQISSQEEITDEASFQQTATPAEQAFFNDAFSSSAAADDVAYAQELEANVISNDGLNGFAGSPLLIDVYGLDVPQGGVPKGSLVPVQPFAPINFTPTLAAGRRLWDTGMSDDLGVMQSTESLVAGNIAARAQSLHQGAAGSALITIVITAVVLLLILLAAVLVARSLVLPLRKLRAGALDIATTQLPERVRQLSEAPDPTVNLEVQPIAVLTADEIGQVARAFDQVHAEAVRLAGNEALLRTSFNAMFVNLSRRSQSLIERLARMIESLEQNEDDPDRLSGLFSMDHLVTRMRRNSENLLLLAGHEGARKWSEPVSLADVARAATSEIEQYSRVVLSIQPGVAVIGQGVSDVVHLLAELVENATLFSPKDTQVVVTGQELSSGGVLIEITDKGIGVSESRLAEINWRLDNPPVIDVSVSRHMGLFAVARLAERHHIRVRLRPANPQGVSALVWLPETVIERTARGYPAAPGGWQQPLSSEQTPLARRAAGQRNIGMRSAIEGRRAGVAEAEAPAGMDLSGDEQASQRESTWFRSQRISATAVGSGSGPRSSAGGNRSTGGWQSMSPSQPSGNGLDGPDPWAQGRHAAEIIADPVRGEQTTAGLPLRVPKANLIPGTAGGPGPSGPGGAAWPDAGGRLADAPNGLPQRSPELARSRLSGFQRGARRAQARRPSAGEGTNS